MSRYLYLKKNNNSDNIDIKTSGVSYQTRSGPKLSDSESELKKTLAEILRDIHKTMKEQKGYETLVDAALKKLTRTNNEEKNQNEIKTNHEPVISSIGKIFRNGALFIGGGLLLTTMALSVPFTAPLFAAATGLTAASALQLSFASGILAISSYVVGGVLGLLEKMTLENDNPINQSRKTSPLGDLAFDIGNAIKKTFDKANEIKNKVKKDMEKIKDKQHVQYNKQQ
ncbi:MAG: hypothetical protein QXD23_03750 [Candidatus Micrarchaeaceae archaeon]